MRPIKLLLSRFGKPNTWAIVVILALLVMPILTRGTYYQHLVTMTFFYASMAMAWNLLGGYTGQLSLGHSAYFGIGAYTTAILFVNLGVSPWVGMLLGGLLAAMVALLFGSVSFKLSSHFFTLATIAFSEVLRILTTYFRDLTRGGVGILISFQENWKHMMFSDRMSYAYLALGLLGVATLVAKLIDQSPLRYYLLAVRENEDAAQALGVNTQRSKQTVMGLSAFVYALTGTFYAMYMLYIDPETSFSVVEFSVRPALLAVFGGLGTLYGPLIGAVLLIPFDMWIHGTLGSMYAGLGNFVFGIALMVIVFWLPDGVVPRIRQYINRRRKQDESASRTTTGDGLDHERRQITETIRPLKDAGTLGRGDNRSPILKVQNVGKTFGGLQAVKDVSFSVTPGEILGLIGPNGAGKTTLFNVVSGFFRPSSGEVKFDDQVVSVGHKPFQLSLKGMTRTFQIVRPFGSMTVLENVATAILVRNHDVGSAFDEAREIVEFVGLGHRADVQAASLTLPDRKRLELARALGARPRLLLLDEVMTGLTPRETEEIIEVVRRISETGVTIIIIEHVMRVVMSLCDRIIVLNHGELIADGTPEEIANNPLVVEAYLGGEAHA